jgi:hypothetical protein
MMRHGHGYIRRFAGRHLEEFARTLIWTGGHFAGAKAHARIRRCEGPGGYFDAMAGGRRWRVDGHGGWAAMAGGAISILRGFGLDGDHRRGLPNGPGVRIFPA